MPQPSTGRSAKASSPERQLRRRGPSVVADAFDAGGTLQHDVVERGPVRVRAPGPRGANAERERERQSGRAQRAQAQASVPARPRRTPEPGVERRGHTRARTEPRQRTHGAGQDQRVERAHHRHAPEQPRRSGRSPRRWRGAPPGLAPLSPRRARCRRGRRRRGAPRAHEVPGREQRDHLHVRAEKGRIAGGGADAGVTHLRRQRAEDRGLGQVEAHDRHHCGDEPHDEVGVEQPVPAIGAAQRPGEHQGKGEPVGAVHEPLHARVGRPEAALRTDAEPGGQGGHREAPRQCGEDGARGRSPARRPQREQRPQRERHRDERACVDRFADGERVVGLRRPDQRREQHERKTCVNGRQQRAFADRAGHEPRSSAPAASCPRGRRSALSHTRRTHSAHSLTSSHGLIVAIYRLSHSSLRRGCQ